MTADQRLSQTLAVADRHTAQLKQLVGLVLQQNDLAVEHSGNIQFALSELIELKREVAGLRSESIESRDKQTIMDAKLDRVLDLLGGNKA